MTKKGTRNIKIKCLETGVIFGTMTDCAKKIGCSQAKVSEHIKFNETIDGLHYIKI